MKNIWIFGDSYGEYYPGGNHWPVQLEDMYKDIAHIRSYAVSGSGLGYSLHQFQTIVKNKFISPNDVIIFILTGDERVYVKSMPHPRLGMLGPLEENLRNNPEWRNWAKNNKDGLAWSIFNIFDPEINYELVKVASVLKVWADVHPENTVILFNNFQSKHIELLYDIPTTSNFFNFSKRNLQLISKMECGFDENSSALEDRKIVMSPYDSRNNHMTYANCNVMAEMLFEVIESKDSKKWNWDRFHKHILRYFEPKLK